MARYTFGGSAADAVWSTVASSGYHFLAAASAAHVTMWSAATGGTQYTDLLDSDGVTPITYVTADVGGQLPTFSGPDGVTSMWADAGGGSRARLDVFVASAYWSVGGANINVAAYASIAAALAAAPSGLKRLILPDGLYTESVTLPDHTSLEGAGPARTVIKLPNGANTSVIKNADHTNGNDNLQLHNLTIDGNASNQAGQAAGVLSSDSDGTVFGVEWHKARSWAMSNVEVKNVDGKGVYIIGDATVTPQSKNGSVLNVECHDNALEGMHIGGAMRRIMLTHVNCYDNGRDGVWLDVSEIFALGVYGYRNGRDGVFIRNTFAATYNSIKANMNGRHGIRALGLVGCDGNGWSAYSNGYVALHNNPQAVSETDSSDVYFDGDATYSYGKTKQTTIVGVTCGAQSPGQPWQDGNQGSPTEDWALRVDSAITDDLSLFAVRALNNGQKGLYSVPAYGAGNFFMEDTPGSSSTARIWRGQRKSIGPMYPGDTTAVGAAIYSGAGVPSNSVGANGDFYLRSGAPATANQRLYNKQAGAWVGIL